MEIRVDRSELLAELVPMQGIVERKSTIPILSHLLLTVRDEKLQLAATDLDVSLTSWAEAEIKEEGGIAVQAKKFIEIIRAVVGDHVSLALESPKMLGIVAGNSRFKINGLLREDFPTLPEAGGAEDMVIPFTDFRRMISKVLFAVSAEESRFQLNGALLKLKEGSLELVATDGHRLALVETGLAGLAEGEGVLVPRKALQELLRFESNEDLTFQRGEHHLSFRVGRRELICRILEGNFPEYDKVLDRGNDKRASFDRKALGEVIHRVALLTGDRSRAVRLKFSTDQLVVSAANPDLGEAIEEMECEYSGPEIRLGLNPDYLGQFIAAVETEKIALDLKDEESQCLGCPIEGQDQRYLCVIMPMRV